jgi:hypothetical protein
VAEIILLFISMLSAPCPYFGGFCKNRTYSHRNFGKRVIEREAFAWANGECAQPVKLF